MPKFIPPTTSDLLPGEEFRVILDKNPYIRSYYMVSNKGRIWSLKMGRIVRLQPCPKGYLRLEAEINGKRIRRRVHRLELQTFKGMPVGNKNITDHLDGDRMNNWLDNLEWVDYYENNRRMHERLKKAA